MSGSRFLSPPRPPLPGQIHLGDGTKWTSAPCASHGGVAYVGAHVGARLQGQAEPTVQFKVHDRSGAGLAACSSGGAVSAVGRLRLRLEGGAAPGGWHETALELEGGRTIRVARALEGALVGAGKAGDAMGQRLEASRHASARGALGGEAAGGGAAADAQAPAAGAADNEPADAALANIAAAAAAAATVDAGGSSVGDPGDVSLEVPAEAAGEVPPDSLTATCVRLRLRYRLLQPPASASLAELPGPAPSRRATIIRLLSGRVLAEQGGGAHAGAAGEAAASECSGAAGEAADPVRQGVPLEVPLQSLPRHLHSYGHGGERVFPPCLLLNAVPDPSSNLSHPPSHPGLLQPSWAPR